ncbi:MAG: DUF559 domain-containing protein [Victivallales bacterium]|jgi:very-short-patch-repair endonuclease
MKEITEKLHSKVMADFKPTIEQMANEGCSQDQIVGVYQAYMRTRVNRYYQKSNFLKAFRDCYSPDDLKKTDSKIETLFYMQLQNAVIDFKFQVVIGPYRVDYLIGGFLIIEIDGPQHKKNHDERRDKYLRKMGYKIIRIPTWILVSCPDAAIQEIKEAAKNGK